MDGRRRRAGARKPNEAGVRWHDRPIRPSADPLAGRLARRSRGKRTLSDVLAETIGREATDSYDMMSQLSQPGRDDLTRDDLFSMLRNERRREVIHYLREHDGPVALRDLSEYIAAMENDCTPEEVTYKQRKRVQTALYQMHLPKLADRRIVEYDRRAGRVELADGADDCLPYLVADAAKPHRRWWRWYLLVAGVVAVPVVLAAAGLRPFASVSGLGYAVAACAAFVAISVAQVVHERGD